VGFDSVPCQIVIAAKEEQAAAFKAINGTTTPISIMALHAWISPPARRPAGIVWCSSTKTSTSSRRRRRPGYADSFALLGVVLIIAILPVVFLRKGTASGGGAH
jgi:hypothetical protein